MNQIFLETRMFRLSDGEEIMTFFVLIKYRSVTDRRTDGRTDIPPLAIPAVCIARYAIALVKSDLSSYGCRIRRSLWSSRSTCLSSFHRVLVKCINSWYYNSKYSEPLRTLREQCFYFFLSDIILSQRDI